MTPTQAVILAGGRGSRLNEKTNALPKAMLTIGEAPILDHIIHHLIQSGVEQIIVASGYRHEIIEKHVQQTSYANVAVEVVNTGLNTNTGGRLKALENYLQGHAFIMCWCDAVSNININALYELHMTSDVLVTIAAVHPPARFGELALKGNQVISYAEKALQKDRWISGGYFVVETSVLDKIKGSDSSWEYDVLASLADTGQLQAYQHHDQWQCMDTVHEYDLLNELFSKGNAFWPLPNSDN